MKGEVDVWVWVGLGVAAPQVFVGGHLPGGEPVEITVDGGRILAMGAPTGAKGDVDLAGKTVLPGFVDSHVHLVYRPQAEAMLRGGVVAAVDLAAPLDGPGRRWPLEVWSAGPMITAVGGYPTRSWGRDGYGLTCTTPASCVAAVDQVIDAGAKVIKVPVDGEPSLPQEALEAVVAHAHARQRKVAVHALTETGAARAAAAGADVLAHAPVEALSEATLASWSKRAVIGTLSAFGGDASVNLGRLHAAGAVVLYGTDFGNTRVAGIAVDELQRMEQAGMTRAEVIAAATQVPAAYWGMEGVGTVVVGGPATFFVVDGDPVQDLSVLGHGQLWVDGRRR